MRALGGSREEPWDPGRGVDPPGDPPCVCPPPSTQMKKVMLTVFKHNHGALHFFRDVLQ